VYVDHSNLENEVVTDELSGFKEYDLPLVRVAVQFSYRSKLAFLSWEAGAQESVSFLELSIIETTPFGTVFSYIIFYDMNIRLDFCIYLKIYIILSSILHYFITESADISHLSQ
jgi:hypothetical protein